MQDRKMSKINRAFEYNITQHGARILRWLGGGVAEVPEEIDGVTVTAIGEYAFSPERSGSSDTIREVILPGGISRIGRYAFYNCRELESLEFPGRLRDIGAGAFTGCHRVRKLTVRMEEDETTCLREILMELPEEMRVAYISDRGKANLLFPEFFEEGVENTPARIIVTHLHGSGMQYRNCFVQKKLQFAEYDRCFALAKAQEDEKLLAELSMSRLMYPLELSEKARTQYAGFLHEHLTAAIRYALTCGNPDAVKLLLTEIRPDEAKLPLLLTEAQRAGDAQAVSRIQEYKRECFGECTPQKADIRSRFSL